MQNIEIEKILAVDTTPVVVYVLASNPSTTPSVLASLAEEESLKIKPEYRKKVLLYLAGNPSTPPETLANLKDRLDISGLYKLAGNPSTPPNVLNSFKDSSDWFLQFKLATNPSTPPDTLEYLNNNTEFNVVKNALAGNPSTPPETLRSLKDSIDISCIRQLAKNPSTPPDILEGFKDSTDINVQTALAGNPSTPPHVLESFKDSTDINVQTALAGNQSTPQKVLEDFKDSPYLPVLYALEENPSTPKKILDFIETNTILSDYPKDRNSMRFLKAEINRINKRFSYTVNGKDIKKTFVFAINRATPQDILAALKDYSKEYYHLQLALAHNPSTPLETKKEFIQIDDWRIKVALASIPDKADDPEEEFNTLIRTFLNMRDDQTLQEDEFGQNEAVLPEYNYSISTPLITGELTGRMSIEEMAIRISNIPVGELETGLDEKEVIR